MKTLKSKNKITLATLKSFAKRNKGGLFVKETSKFDGMSDMVEQNRDPQWRPTTITDETNYYRTGIQGIYTVGDSRDYFEIYEDEEYFGIEVYNCCGNSILAVKK